MPFVIFLSAVVMFAGWRLSTRYEYTRKARTVLSWAAVGCVVVALFFNLWLFPGLNFLYLILAIAGVFLPIYAIVALAIVEAWRKRRQSVFDESIGALRRDEEHVLEELTRAQQQIVLAEHKRQTLEEIHRERLGDQRRVRSFLDQWERAEGLARIRSIKIQEWRELFKGLSAAGLGERRAELEGQLADLERASNNADADDRLDQIRAQLSVASLVSLAAKLDQPNAELAELERRLDETKLNRADAERRLEALRFELAEWERRRHEFLAEQIRIGE